MSTFAEATRDEPHRPPRMLRVVLALALLVAFGLTLRGALVSPGQAIHSELEAAADDLQAPGVGAREATLRHLRTYFPRYAATVEARGWPQVAVTLHGLPRETCRDAALGSRRIEGLVVVELEKYHAAEECGTVNDMTWRFMP